MVKVRILQSAQGPGTSYKSGEIKEVTLEKAVHWQKTGFAEIVEYTQGKKETAVNPKVTTAQHSVFLLTKDKDIMSHAKPKRGRKRVTKD